MPKHEGLALGILKNTRVLCVLGVMTAMVIVLNRLLRVDIGFARFSLGSVCTVMAGIWFGPAGGALVGFLADLLGSLLQGYAPNPIISVAAILWGVIPALMIRFVSGPRVRRIVVLCLSVYLTSIISTVILNTMGLVLMLGYRFESIFPTRLIQWAVMTPVYCVLVCCLYFSPIYDFLQKNMPTYRQKSTVKE